MTDQERRREIAPGDRVWLMLRNGRVRERRFEGTVLAVDDIAGIPGVRIALDVPCNGVTDCYATHDETHAVESVRCGECGGELEPYTPEDRPHIFWRCVECATAHGVRPDELPENTDA